MDTVEDYIKRSIFLPQSAKVKDYSAAVKGPVAVVTVKIEVKDTYGLASLLEELGDMKKAHARRVAKGEAA